MSQLEKRLDELAALEPGWYDGDGESIDPIDIHNARKVIEYLATRTDVHIFPTFEGAVHIECGGTEWDVEIEFLDSEIEAIAFSNASDDMVERNFTGQLISQIAGFVTKYTGAQ